MFSKVKFSLAFILILCVLMPGIGFAGTGPGLPEIFRVSYDVHEEEINNGSCYVYKEYLKTSSSIICLFTTSLPLYSNGTSSSVTTFILPLTTCTSIPSSVALT